MGEALTMKRREFLIGLGLAPLAAVAAKAGGLEPIRQAYVKVGDFPASLTWHIWDDRPLMPTGPLLVTDVLPWDGHGYPIIMATLGWREADRVHYPGGYDHDWSVLRRDVPPHFWRTHSTDQYPNVHAYVREQRFGEPPSVMREAMERNRVAPWRQRARVQPLTKQAA